MRRTRKCDGGKVLDAAGGYISILKDVSNPGIYPKVPRMNLEDAPYGTVPGNKITSKDLASRWVVLG